MIEPSNAEKAEWSDVTRDYVHALEAEIERLKREVMLQMGWKTEAQNEVERLERSRSAWEDEARHYAGNSEYWQTETERLREALRDILRGDDPAIPSAIEHMARAALGETE